MIFNIRDYLKAGLLAAVGQAPDYKVILDSMEWHKAGLLDEADLAEIQAAIDAKNAEPVVEEVTPEEVTESEAE